MIDDDAPTPLPEPFPDEPSRVPSRPPMTLEKNPALEEELGEHIIEMDVMTPPPRETMAGTRAPMHLEPAAPPHPNGTGSPDSSLARAPMHLEPAARKRAATLPPTPIVPPPLGRAPTVPPMPLMPPEGRATVIGHASPTTGPNPTLGRTPTGQHPTVGRTPTGQHPSVGRTTTGQHAAIARTPTGQHPVVARAPTGQHPVVARAPTGQHPVVGRTPTGQHAIVPPPAGAAPIVPPPPPGATTLPPPAPRKLPSLPPAPPGARTEAKLPTMPPPATLRRSASKPPGSEPIEARPELGRGEREVNSINRPPERRHPDLETMRTNPPPLRKTGLVGDRDEQRITAEQLLAAVKPDPDVATTEPSMPVFEEAGDTQPRLQLPLTAPPSNPALQLPQNAQWAAGLAARIDAALDGRETPAGSAAEGRRGSIDEDFGGETPVIAPTKAELRALLGQPDVTRKQSFDEIARLQRAVSERAEADEPEILQHRRFHRTTEVDPDDIEAVIEVAPHVRRKSNPIAVAKPKKPAE
jgi:hypothetical protein